MHKNIVAITVTLLQQYIPEDRALKNWNKLDILPEILEECPDQSILPLVANWEAADASTK